MNPRPKTWMMKVGRNHWLVAGVSIRRSKPPVGPSPCNLGYWVDRIDACSYELTRAPDRLTGTPCSREDEYVTKRGVWFYHGEAWSIGNQGMVKTDLQENITPELTTLEYVRAKLPQTFELPTVLHHTTVGNRNFRFMHQPGRTLESAWPELSQGWRNTYIRAIADAMDEMAQWVGPQVGGVDGCVLAQSCLSLQLRRDNPNNAAYVAPKPGGDKTSYHFFDYNCVLDNLKNMGLDCSRPVFMHNMLNPRTIYIEHEPHGTIWLINWELAGFAPREYLRTHTYFDGQLYFAKPVLDTSIKFALVRELKARGYPHCHWGMIDFNPDYYGMFHKEFPEQMARKESLDHW